MTTLLQQIHQQAARLSPARQAELLDYAMYLEKKTKTRSAMQLDEQARRQGLAEALKQASALNPYREITDPVAWQREQRIDRQLPGRPNAD